jgi:chromosome partitioning protein
MTKTITITNQKGGVAKTTTSTHLAHGLALAGHNVLVVDLDPQGQVAEFLAIPESRSVFDLLIAQQPPASLVVNARERLAVITGNNSTAAAQVAMSLDLDYYTMEHIANALKPVAPQYDYIILDTPPSTGGLQERSIWAADWVIIPTATEYMSLTSVEKTTKTLLNLRGRGWGGKLLGILPVLYDNTRESQECMNTLNATFPQSILGAIHRATIMRETAAGRTVFERYPLSRAAKEYQVLVNLVQRAK